MVSSVSLALFTLPPLSSSTRRSLCPSFEGHRRAFFRAAASGRVMDALRDGWELIGRVSVVQDESRLLDTRLRTSMPPSRLSPSLARRRRVQRSRLTRCVALCSPPSILPNARLQMLLGIEREIVIMKLIEHPNVLRLMDVWETEKELSVPPSLRPLSLD